MKKTGVLEKLRRLGHLERILLAVSFSAPVISFFAFKGTDYLNLVSSVIGIAMLFLIARANVFSSLVSMAFSVTYSIVAYRFHYYGEMILYLALYIPVEIYTFIVWLAHRYKDSSQVTVDAAKPGDFALGTLVASAVTFGAYFLLRHLGTENIFWSTVSVFTSMIACYFLIRRTSFYAVFYIINDIILIILWAYASVEDRSYVCMTVCFVCFLLNDIYGLINWSRIRRTQEIR